MPQSSCSLSPIAPATICSSSAAGRLALPLPRKPRFTGRASAASSMRSMCQGPGGAGGGVGARRRAGPAAQHGGDPRHQGVLDLLGADEVDVRVDRPGGEDEPFPRNGFGAGADDHVHPRLGVGVAGLADLGDASALDAHVGLDDAPMVEDERVGDDRVDGAGGGELALSHPVPDHLAAPELDLLAGDRAVGLHLDHQLGVPEPDAIPGSGTEHLRVSPPADRAHGFKDSPWTRNGSPPARGAGEVHRPRVHPDLRFPARPRRWSAVMPGEPRRSRKRLPTRPPRQPKGNRASGRRSAQSTGPSTAPWNPMTCRRPAKATSPTSRSCPGSNRTAVPAGMSSR